MFKKLIGFTALAGVIAVGSGIGCSVTTTTTTTDGGSSDTDAATTGTTTTPRPDSGRPDAAPASCYDEEAALALQGTAPTQGQNKCSSAAITEFATKCLGAGGNQAACTAFIDANKDCGRCLFGPLQGDDPKAFPHPALIPVSEDSVSPNIAACAAIVANQPACATKLANEIVCTSTACGTCEAAGEEACDAEARAGICKDTIDATCNTAVNAASAQWQPICRGTNFDDTFNKVANFLCGAGSADAGGGG